jgi:hypothetical protein
VLPNKKTGTGDQFFEQTKRNKKQSKISNAPDFAIIAKLLDVLTSLTLSNDT